MYGERIKTLREAYGMSEMDLAVEMQTTPYVISQWEEEEISPTIEDLIGLADIFETTLDWIAGFDDEEEEYEEEYEGFIPENIVPHMNQYIRNNEEPAYVHLQLSLNDDGEDCVIYSGKTEALLSAANMLLKSVADETNINYYDLVAIMATMQAKTETEGL